MAVLPLSGTTFNVLLPDLKVTDPVGVPALDALTVALKVTVWL
jgi:hypothetical protein